jgi:hypothetical protein
MNSYIRCIPSRFAFNDKTFLGKPAEVNSRSADSRKLLYFPARLLEVT